MNPRDFTNFSTEALMEELKALAEDLSEDPRSLIIEAMDRLELISIEAVDLAHGLSKARQDSDFWQEKATKAMNKSKRLEENGDRLLTVMREEEGTAYCEWVGLAHDAEQNWLKAKEAKP